MNALALTLSKGDLCPPPLPMPPPSFAQTALLSLEGILAPARKMGRGAHGIVGAVLRTIDTMPQSPSFAVNANLLHGPGGPYG